MKLLHLKLYHFRNFTSFDIQPHPGLNILVGPNGSGKTNLLEAIYHLATAKSFRTTCCQWIVQRGQQTYTIYGLVGHDQLAVPIGIERGLKSAPVVQINHQTPATFSELSQQLPLRLMNPDSFQLLTGGPKNRRQLMNWGAFQQEAQFWPAWKSWARALKQRNSALKFGHKAQIRIWDAAVAEHGAKIADFYREYLDLLTPYFQRIIAEFLPEVPVSLKFYAGWDRHKTLGEVLEDTLHRDMARGFTAHGPHRADIRIKVGTVAAKELLSRGQQKLVVTALLLAQGLLLQESHQLSCVYLLDDLPSELDKTNFAKVLSFLQQINAQVFITGVEAEAFSGLQAGMFHVEHGALLTPV